MSGVVSGTGFQSTLEPPSQDLRSRDISKSSRITSTLSGARRSPSPSASQSHGLLSKDASSSHVTRLSPPVGQFVINTLLQIAGFVAAIAFGIYAVQSVKVGKDANQWADIANQLALLDLCMSSDNQTGAIGSICSRILYHAATALPDIASTLFPNLPTVPPSSSTSAITNTATITSAFTTGPSSSSAPAPTAPEHGASSGPLAAIIAGSVIGGLIFICIVVFILIRRHRKRRYAAVTPAIVAASVEKPTHPDTSESMLRKFRKLFVETRVITEPQ